MFKEKIYYMNKAEEKQARVNKFLKNIQGIKRLIEVRSNSYVSSQKFRNISLQDHGLQKAE